MAAPRQRTRYLAYVTILVHLCGFLGIVKGENKIFDVSPTELDKLVSANQFVLAYFYTDNCPECNKARAQIQLVADTSGADLKVVQSNDLQKAYQYNMRVIPGILYFRNGIPITYTGSPADAEELLFWIDDSKESAVKVLSEDNFEHDTQAASGATTGDWFILFHKPSCLSNIQASWEAVASSLKNRVIVASVDTALNKKLEERFSIKSCPTYVFFHHGKMYSYELEKQDVKSLVSFAEGWYKNVQAVPVPVETTPFDALTDTIAQELKQAVVDNNWAVLGLFAGAVMLPLLTLCCCCFVLSGKKQKAE